MTGEWIVQSLMTIAILSRGDAWSARCAIGCRRPSGPTTFGGCVGVRVSVLDSVVWLLASEVIVGFRDVKSLQCLAAPWHFVDGIGYDRGTGAGGIAEAVPRRGRCRATPRCPRGLGLTHQRIIASQTRARRLDQCRVATAGTFVLSTCRPLGQGDRRYTGRGHGRLDQRSPRRTHIHIGNVARVVVHLHLGALSHPV